MSRSEHSTAENTIPQNEGIKVSPRFPLTASGQPPSRSQVVAAEVRALMAAKRRDQRELGKLLGISQSAVSRRYLGDVPFDINEIEKVAEWLGVPVTRLLTPEQLPQAS